MFRPPVLSILAVFLGPVFASAQTAGRLIHDAIVANRAVVYVPWFWRWISLIVRMLPARFVRF